MPLPPSTPPPSSPPYVNVEEYLQNARLPPSIETTVVEELADTYQKALSEVEWLEERSEMAALVLGRLSEAVERHGASNLLQVIETVDAAARETAERTARLPKMTRDFRKIAQEMRRIGREFSSIGMPQASAEAFARANAVDKSVELMKRRQDAFHRILDAYRSTLRVLVRLRDSDLVRASSSATYALMVDRGYDGTGV
jgi:hypothetical protein